jgi:hypothetical protein
MAQCYSIGGFTMQLKIGRMITLMLVFVSHYAYSNSCPPSANLDPLNPPAGWVAGPSPYEPGYTYEFGLAVHSFIPDDNYGKIFCRYEVCPSFGCYYFELISTARYQQPYYTRTPPPPWYWSYSFQYTIKCRPGGDRPELCTFS